MCLLHRGAKEGLHSAQQQFALAAWAERRARMLRAPSAAPSRQRTPRRSQFVHDRAGMVYVHQIGIFAPPLFGSNRNPQILVDLRVTEVEPIGLEPTTSCMPCLPGVQEHDKCLLDRRLRRSWSLVTSCSD